MLMRTGVSNKKPDLATVCAVETREAGGLALRKVVDSVLALES